MVDPGDAGQVPMSIEIATELAQLRGEIGQFRFERAQYPWPG